MSDYKTIEITELESQITEIINSGESVFITDGKKPVAVILPIEDYQEFVLYKAHAIADERWMNEPIDPKITEELTEAINKQLLVDWE
jgi:antitoxin (DNA-binding transcriptional repressor) of toxin-antitoxin stability system